MKHLAHIPKSRGDKIFDVLNYIILGLVLLAVLYPLYLIVISSVSDPTAVNSGNVRFFPEGFNLKGYQLILENKSVWRGFLNSFIYTALSIIVGLTLTLTAGYALSRKELVGRNFFMLFITFTMFFSGGLIPSYLLVNNLGLTNTPWALILPSAVSVTNLIVTKTFFQSSISENLIEVASIEGANQLQIFLKIVLPLSTPLIAVMALFIGVAEWNSWFPALIYLRDETLYPLQLILRNILISNQTMAAGEAIVDPEAIAEQQQYQELIKYALIIVSSVPMLVIYPFVQKYFVKGIIIGSIKG